MRSTRRGLILPFLAWKNSDGHQSKKKIFTQAQVSRELYRHADLQLAWGQKSSQFCLLIKIVSRDITNPDKICRAKCHVSLLMLDGDLSVAVCLLEKLKKTTCYESLAVRRLEFIHEVITESTFIFMKDSRCHVNILTDNIQCRSNSFLTDLSAFYDHVMVFSFSRLFYSSCS